MLAVGFGAAVAVAGTAVGTGVRGLGRCVGRSVGAAVGTSIAVYCAAGGCTVSITPGTGKVGMGALGAGVASEELVSSDHSPAPPCGSPCTISQCWSGCWRAQSAISARVTASACSRLMV